MQRFLTKNYSFTLKIPTKRLFFTTINELKVEYGSATVAHTIEFEEKIKEGNKGLVDWMLGFIGKHSGKKLSKSDILYIVGNIDSIFNVIDSTFFDGCFIKGSKDIKGEPSPMSSYIMMLTEKTSISPDKLINNYTPKQLEFMTEGIIWNANVGTEEGKKANRLKMKELEFKQKTPEELANIEAMLKALDDKD